MKRAKPFIVVALACSVLMMAPVALSQQPPQGPLAQAATQPRPGAAAPDFEIPAIDGTLVRLSSMRGKIVLLEFTATWCPACYQAASDLRKLRRQFGSTLSLISISLDGGENTDTTREDLLRFVRKEGVDWPVLFDDTGTDNSAALAYGVERLPAYVLIDHAGIVRLIKEGAGTSGTIEREVRILIAALPRN